MSAVISRVRIVSKVPSKKAFLCPNPLAHGRRLHIDSSFKTEAIWQSHILRQLSPLLAINTDHAYRAQAYCSGWIPSVHDTTCQTVRLSGIKDLLRGLQKLSNMEDRRRKRRTRVLQWMLHIPSMTLEMEAGPPEIQASMGATAARMQIPPCLTIVKGRAADTVVMLMPAEV